MLYVLKTSLKKTLLEKLSVIMFSTQIAWWLGANQNYGRISQEWEYQVARIVMRHWSNNKRLQRLLQRLYTFQPLTLEPNKSKALSEHKTINYWICHNQSPTASNQSITLISITVKVTEILIRITLEMLNCKTTGSVNHPIWKNRDLN